MMAIFSFFSKVTGMVLLLFKIPQKAKFFIREWPGTVKERIRCWLLVTRSWSLISWLNGNSSVIPGLPGQKDPTSNE